MRYASKTGVASDRSRSEIEKTLLRYRASSFIYANWNGQAAILADRKGRK